MENKTQETITEEREKSDELGPSKKCDKQNKSIVKNIS